MNIGVVVPTYGRAASVVERTVAALTSSEPDVPEVVIVDQNEGPRREAIAEVAFRHGVRHISLATPNASRARNVGALALGTDTVGFVDDDIVLSPSALRCAAAVFETRLDVDCVWASVVDVGTAPRRSTEHGSLRRVHIIRSDALFFRAEAFRRSGGFDPHLFTFARAVEDHELLRRMRRRGIDVWQAGSVQAVHYAEEPGGCEMRSIPRVENERRCVFGMAYAERTLHHGRLGPLGVYRLSRSFILNGDLLRRPFKATRDRGKQLCEAVASSRAAIAPHRLVYASTDAIDHLAAERFVLENPWE